MKGLFVDEYGVRPWSIFAGAALLIGGVTLALVLVFGSSTGCPKGQIEVQTGIIPIKAGSTWIMDPIFTCEAVR